MNTLLLTLKADLQGQFFQIRDRAQSRNITVSQSLAGWTALLKLLPLSWEELQRAGYNLSRDEALVKGFLPRVWQDHLPPLKTYLDYFADCVERDLRQILQIRDLNRFETFLRLLAGRVGQVVNLHALSGDVGVSSTTLADRLAALEASFIIFRLHP